MPADSRSVKFRSKVWPMHMRIVLFMLGASLSLPCSAQTSDPVRADIIAAEDGWRQARIMGDTRFLDHFYAKEGRIQNMNGDVVSRQEDIAIFASGKIKPKFIDHGPLEIAVYGDTALVTGVDHLGGTAFGQYGEMYLRFTDVLVKREGRWQLIIQQATKAKGF